MTTRLLLLLRRAALAVVLAMTLGCAEAWAGEILVAAAASLTDVLKEIGARYEAQSQQKVRFNFASSNTLARQIDEGAPVDVFISANISLMHDLEKRGRMEPDSKKNLLANQLVVIAPVRATIKVAEAKDLLMPQIKRIAIAQPGAVPAGVYARKYLESHGLWSMLQAKVVPLLDVRATLAAVASGNVDVGFVYKTDATISNEVRVSFAVPLAAGPKIIYPVALLSASKNKPAAAQFLSYLTHSAARQIFESHGFIVLR